MIDIEKEEQASKLRGSLIEFSRFFYEYITGRKFIISQPIGRESHHITICKELTRIYRLEILRGIINTPPGSNKSTLVSMFIAWCWAQHPDSNFLYISYAIDLAAKHTAFIKSIVSSRMYGYLFDVQISSESKSKEAFKTTRGGSIKAFGSGGPITGQDGGLPGLDRFSGAVIIDDAHKPSEVHSDTLRQKVITNYDETIRQRPRGIKVPIIYIGQRVHEDDLTAHLLSGKDVDTWDSTIIKGLDEAGNALYPEMMTREKLLALQEKSPYVFAGQYQQDPLPAGGGLFKEKWFVLLEEEPKFILTFITADTAETEDSWNDATVFNFLGLYEIESMGVKTGEFGLHCIDLLETRIEPKDLQEEFLQFYVNACRHPKPPLIAVIEEKSTGVTLASVLESFRGLSIRKIKRTRASGSKTDRFIEMQPHIAAKKISLPANAPHTKLVVTHMTKITANNTHKHDDIADTFYDGIHLALIEKTLYAIDKKEEEQKQILDNLSSNFQRKIKAGAARYGSISKIRS